DPAAVDRALADCGLARRFEDMAAPLLAQWQEAGLMTAEPGALPLTLAGRFWQVAMTARLIAWTDQAVREHTSAKENAG
ncbi:hypothetical protein JMM59_19190, partial [Rhodovulum sulfidophilum]|uniref:hypothetical protein n=1 Tax=Rhodovulum sulfidophilum TaxID=35806 RepID=UPI0019241F95